MRYGKKDIFVFVFLSTMLLLLTGCATAKGLTEGLSKDAKDTWSFLTRADSWMKKNLW